MHLMCRILVLCILCCPLFAHLTPPPLEFKPVEQPSCSPLKVNVITGEYHDETCDLVSPGVQPLSYRRFYNHQGHLNIAHGHWRVNPEALLLFKLKHKLDPEAGRRAKITMAGIGDERGSFCPASKKLGSKYVFDPNINSAFSTGDGRKHPLNLEISVSKDQPHKAFAWTGEITDGEGRRRTFRSEIGHWGPSIIDPIYQARDITEYLPNGNKIVYTFEDADSSNKHKNKRMETCYVIKQITAFDSFDTEINRLNCVHTPAGPKNDYTIKRTTVSDSSKRKAVLQHKIIPVRHKNRKRGHRYQFDVVLDRVEAPGQASKSYGYKWDKAKYYYSRNFMTNSFADGSAIQIDYDFNTKKVACQRAPIGSNGQWLPIASYQYYSDHTVVRDGEGNRSIYRFDENKRLIATEYYQGDQLLRKISSKWDVNGNLLEQTVGPRKTTYRYDERHNPIEETTDGYTTYRTYDPQFNVITAQWDDFGKRVICTYKEGTNLPQEILTYDCDQVCKREYFEYDASAACTLKVEEDRISRREIRITPKKEMPCYGLPEEVEEYCSGKLLHRKKITYHPSGQILQEDHYDSHGAFRYSLINEYDDQERLIASTDALGYTRHYSYDERFNLIEISDGKSTKTRRYDAANRVIEERDGDLVTRYEYDRCSRVTAKIDPCGYKTSYQYDALGNTIKIIHPDGAVEQMEYDALGNITKKIDPKGYVTTTTYNVRSQPLEIHHPDGTSQSFIYNTDGTLASHTTMDGTCHYRYDVFGNVVQTLDCDRETSATYSAFHKLFERDAEGVTTNYFYKDGRLVKKCCKRQQTTYEYDELGRQSVVHEGDSSTYYSYDLKDQLIEKRINDCFLERYTYDEHGNRIAVESCQGVAVTEYNENDLVTKEVDGSGNTTTIAYSYEDGFSKTITNPNGVVTVERYDSRDRLVLSQKNERIQKRDYDLNGNLINLDTNGVSHSWEYGPMDRLESSLITGKTIYEYDYWGKLSTTIKPDGQKLQRSYDRHGRLSRFYGVDFDYSYVYDKNDRMLSVGDVERRYDAYGNCILERLPTGLTIRREYTSHGQQIALHLPDASTVRYSYRGPYLFEVSYEGYTHTYFERNLSGQPTKTSTTQLEYDAAHRLTQLSSLHYSTSYSYDGCGNLLQSDGDEYAYDDQDQMVVHNLNTYNYDDQGNRISVNDSRWSFNEECQNEDFTYDANGNLISDGIHSYSYDSLDRLIGYDDHSFTYDAFDRRLTRDGVPYIWDGDLEIGSPTELRILGEGMGAEIGAAVLLKLGGKSYIPTHDHRGCLVALSDLDGNLVERYEYSTFGEERTCNRLSPWRFASKRQEGGLIYFGRRYYIPSQGRWLTPDPLGLADGANLYSYVHNNPHHIDCFGLYDESISCLSEFSMHIGIELALSGLEKAQSFNFGLMRAGYDVDPVPHGGAIFWIPGICYSLDDAYEVADYISQLGGGVNVQGTYFATQGKGLDALSVLLAKSHRGLTDEVSNACTLIGNYFNEVSDVPCLLIVHSGGSQVAHNVLERMTVAERDRVIVRSVAPCKFISPRKCRDVRSFVAEPTRDAVPHFDLLGRIRFSETVKVVKSHPSAPRMDHSFMSPTYRPHIQQFVRDYCKNTRSIK
ncbi:MAG: hypothetical protein S4CHLAM81_08030 [Chlamydiales bacterium]|nr:hypothetical protein [Chlamydiales bacterium]MCH9635585.1 hypothetical protein [Chlamydiales bacterium]